MVKDAHIKNKEFYFGKRVLVTGHTGFKGAWLCETLNYMGATVQGYALNPEKGSLYERIKGDDLINSVEGDVRNYDLLKKTIEDFQPELVFHLAAMALVKDCYDDPLNAYSTNVMGTVNLLQVLRTCSTIKSIVIVTTDKVYENKGDGAIYSEEDQLGGSDPYSTSKTSMENIVKAYRDSYYKKENCNVGLATVRASNVLAGGDHVISRLIPSILDAVAKKQSVELRNPNQTRPWQFVLDALNGYLTIGRLLYNNPKDYSEAWNIGPTVDGIRTVSWVFDKIRNYYDGLNSKEGQHFLVRESETLGLDIHKAMERLDWKPLLSCERTIEMVVDFFRMQQDGIDEHTICRKQIEEFYKKCID